MLCKEVMIDTVFVCKQIRLYLYACLLAPPSHTQITALHLIHLLTQTALPPPTVPPPLVSEANTTLSVCPKRRNIVVRPALRPPAQLSHNLAMISNLYQHVAVCRHPGTTLP